MAWTSGKWVMLPFALLLFVTLPSPGHAQTSCAMEQHIVDSWTATVKADQDSIQQLQQSDKFPEEKLAELKPLNARLQNAVQRLQQAKSRLADCQKKASGSAPPAPAKPQPVSLSNFHDAGWQIDGLGILTLGQPDPDSQTVAGVLTVQRDGLEGIPRNTKLTMDGALQGNGNGFTISGTTLTKGNYLDFRKKEVYAYEYRLTLEAQFDDAKTRRHLSGTATLIRSERYRGDKKGTRLESFGITGAHSEGAIKDSIHIWIRAFIPRHHPGNPGYIHPITKVPSRFVIPDPWPTDFDDCFESDERDFDSARDASSRIMLEVNLMIDGPGIISDPASGVATPGLSREVDCVTGVDVVDPKKTDTSRTHAHTPTLAAGVVRIPVVVVAANPLFRHSPAISCRGVFEYTIATKELRFEGQVGKFPSFEAYAQLNDGPINTVFQVLPAPGSTVMDLYRGAVRATHGTAHLGL